MGVAWHDYFILVLLLCIHRAAKIVTSKALNNRDYYDFPQVL